MAFKSKVLKLLSSLEEECNGFVEIAGYYRGYGIEVVGEMKAKWDFYKRKIGLFYDYLDRHAISLPRERINFDILEERISPYLKIKI